VNRTQTSLLKKLSNQIRIELIKNSNRTNQIRVKTESNIKQIMSYEFSLHPMHDITPLKLVQ
jgi:hypothetical protein